MQRLVINDLKNWSKWILPLQYQADDGRVIEVHVNCEKPTPIYARFGSKKKETQFVGVAPQGKSELVLNLEGEVHLAHEGEGEVWFYDPSGRNERRSAPEQVSFTGPLNRQVRDPELERLMHKMEMRQINRERKRDEEAAKLKRQIAAMRAKGATVDEQTGEVIENVPNDTGATGAGAAGDTGNAVSGATGGTQDTPEAGQEQKDPAAADKVPDAT
jgi:hypothetical protein